MFTLKKRLIHLHSCPHISRKILRSILLQDPELKTIYHSSIANLQSMYHLPLQKAERILSYIQQTSPDQCLSYLKSKEIQTITFLDSDYPLLLKKIYDPPLVLYALGDKTVLCSEQRLAVIGTRAPTPIGRKTVSTLIPPITKKGWTIVSGFAKGIDSLAHWEAVNASGTTIAVLGSGHSYVYPKENVSLFSQMSKSHLILSEYPPQTPPQKWHFPARNRIISGLSKAVLVIEAKEKSGSLITADQALEQGRDVFAVPGSIYSPQSQGTNYLIQQGAMLVRNEYDILQGLDA
ncbi:DNA-processing protein DprA [Alkalihalobacillus sp. MEB130]|uniref:DNA-processing protein DprA n=1 Tax=Alkalihalobacillus sp. MEB130 TaxID=2976704 RepID=UPI0028DF2A34|nr:DNA-processing protein DprA [Alkalihalobacillus sp. MEB130]MDT8859039.1 DNA-processing protein DprA [Alkalihalobacillus sp. MEB130]